ncbi:hypothetical protein HPB50_028098 [Hyalomma asiaticum]|nr:hypothetical protein HPB50_028098 [Hyalomma asiaticum]
MDRLKQKRSSARAQNTKIINEATGILQSDSADRATLITLKERLTSSNDKLKKISEEMEDHIPTDEHASEYAAAADYEDQALNLVRDGEQDTPAGAKGTPKIGKKKRSSVHTPRTKKKIATLHSRCEKYRKALAHLKINMGQDE